MKNKINIIALFGRSGSGKDTVRNKLLTAFPFETNKIINCTTRPKREKEINGIDYHFLSNEDFTKLVLNGDLIEATEFNNWFYGTDIKELDENKINIGIFNPTAINLMLDDNRLNILPVYVQTEDKILLQRALNREEKPNCVEICRRFCADARDFAYIDFDFNYFDNNDVNALQKESIEKLYQECKIYFK